MSPRHRLEGRVTSDHPTLDRVFLGQVRKPTIWIIALVPTNAALAIVGGFMGPWWGRTIAVVEAAAVALLLWWLGEREVASVAQERIDAAAETSVAISDALLPTTGTLGHIARENKDGRRQQREGLVMQVLAAATGLVPTGDRPRACYFRMDANGDCLRHYKSQGRGDDAKAVFRAGTPEGDAALRMVKHDGKLFCYDVRDDPPPGWVQSERGEYLTFVSVTVAVGGVAYGMLTLDAKTPGSISDEDGEMLRVLARILAVAECLSG